LAAHNPQHCTPSRELNPTPRPPLKGWILDAWYGDDKNKSKAAAAVGAVALPTDASSEWGKAAAAHAARHRPTALRRLQAHPKSLNPIGEP